MFEPSSPGWHPMARQFNLEKFPAMMLIDRKGTLRSLQAEKDFEEQIPKLIAEPAE